MSTNIERPAVGNRYLRKETQDRILTSSYHKHGRGRLMVKARALALNLALALAALILALAATEVLLRALPRDRTEKSYLVDSMEFSYRYSLNSRGYRGPEFPASRKQDELRVILITSPSGCTARALTFS
jgi:hypothetical protein